MPQESPRTRDVDAVGFTEPRRTALLAGGLFTGSLAALLAVVAAFDFSMRMGVPLALACLAAVLLAISLRFVFLWRTLPRHISFEGDSLTLERGDARLGRVSLPEVREVRSIGWGLAPGVRIVDQMGKRFRVPHDIHDAERVLEAIALGTCSATPHYEIPVRIAGVPPAKFVRDLLMWAGLPAVLGLWAFSAGELALGWALCSVALLVIGLLAVVAYRKPIRIEITGDGFCVVRREGEVRLPFDRVESVRLCILSLGSASQSSSYVSVMPKQGEALVLRPYGTDPVPLFRVLRTQLQLAQEAQQ